MRQHYRLLSDTKQQYREMLQQLQASLEDKLRALREDFHCDLCAANAEAALNHFLQPTHSGCGYQAWQRAALSLIETDIAAAILNRLQAIEAYKNTFDCHLCGMCCRMASTDASYEVLQARAKNGDEFARQFTSIFLPYASLEKARENAPEVVAAVLAEAAETQGENTDIHFYHCPYVGEDNRCTVYGTEKRPAICSSYPETPLSFVYEKCAWKPWKDETHPDTLMAHAMLALCTQFAEKLRASLSLPQAGLQ